MHHRAIDYIVNPHVATLEQVKVGTFVVTHTFI